MNPETITDILACPTDKRPFSKKDISCAKWEGKKIVTAQLCCLECRAMYPIRDRIAYLLPPHLSKHSFIEQGARDTDAPGYPDTKGPYETTQEKRALCRGIKFSPDTVVLDIGAGTGRYTHGLAEKAGQVWAVDLSPQMLRLNDSIARATLAPDVAARITYVVADATALPFQPGKIDVACSAQMLEHLAPDTHVKCLTGIREALTPNGHLAMSVYNLKATGGDIKDHLADIPSLVLGTFPDEHRGNNRSGHHSLNGEPGRLYYHNFTHPELEALLLQAGFSIDRITGILSIPARLQNGLIGAQLDQLITEHFLPFARNRGLFLVAHATPV